MLANSGRTARISGCGSLAILNIRLAIESASAKVTEGHPTDEDEDYDIPIWAGVVPVTTTTGNIITDPQVLDGVAPSPVVEALQNKRY